MKKVYQLAAVALASCLLVFTACKKEKDPLIENPDPVEEELITTVRLIVKNSTGFNKTFNYKVENGFNSASQGTLTVDDIVLSPNMEYDVTIEVWNEAETPAENITDEVIAENVDHLFVLVSSPATGAGAISVKDGSKDDNGNPLNQKLKFVTGMAGNGTLTITLKHEPTNKNAVAPDTAGGETDAEAKFDVKLE